MTALAVFFIALVPTTAVALTTIEAPTAQPSVVKQSRIKPDQYKRSVVRFVPDSQPSPARVRQIADIEAAKWGVSSSRLKRRINCESTFRWYASNGGKYLGLLQFAPNTFYRGFGSIKTRKVRYKRSRIVYRHTIKVAHLSDGTRRYNRRGYKVPVRRTRIYVGWLPKRVPVTHGWAQIRIGAQAMAGRSAVSSGEWGCSA